MTTPIPTPDRIRTAMVRELTSVRTNLEVLRTQVTLLESQEKALEDTIIRGLDAGVPVDPGAPTLAIHEWTRRNISWVTEFEKALGRERVAEVTEATKPTTYRDLLIGVQARIRGELLPNLTTPRYDEIIEHVVAEGGTIPQVLKEVRSLGYKLGWSQTDLIATQAVVKRDMERLIAAAVQTAAKGHNARVRKSRRTR